MDVGGLTPVQRRVVEDLMDRGNAGARPHFDPNLSIRLRDALEDALAPLAASLGVGELHVNKKALAQVLACEAHHRADGSSFPGWTPRLARGTVAHKAIELAVHMGGDPDPLSLVDAAVDRLVAADDERGPGRYLADADPAERAELRSEVNDIVVKFRECWPPLPRSWRPRTEASARVELCDGRIVLSSRVDLALGMASGTEARVLVVDLKTGGAYPGHLDDLRFYALIHTVRTGVPPYRVATYYLDSCSFVHEDVDEPLLTDVAVARAVDGITRLAELHLGHRAPSLSPGPACRWCSLRDGCDGAVAWAARHDGVDVA